MSKKAEVRDIGNGVNAPGDILVQQGRVPDPPSNPERPPQNDRGSGQGEQSNGSAVTAGLPPRCQTPGLRSLLPETRNIAPADQQALAKWPCLYVVLTTPCFEDDKGKTQPRKQGRIGVYVEGPAYKVTLTLEQEKISLGAESDSLEGVFDALEAKLRDPRVAWKRWVKKG